MEKIKVQKGKTIKEIPADFKKAYISAGWGELKNNNQPKVVGVDTNNK